MSGALVWGVKASFVEYVAALGAVEVVAPATRADDGAFRFPEAEDGDGYLGGVAFRAHHGALDVVLRAPRLDGGVLTVEFDDHGREQGRTVIGQVVGERVALAASGAVVFDFTYPIGADLAPVRIEHESVATAA